MNKHFYNGPKIIISEDFIRIKDRNIKLAYGDIKNIRIINTRQDSYWMVYIVIAIIISIIIGILCFRFLSNFSNVHEVILEKGYFRGPQILFIIAFFFIVIPIVLFVKALKKMKKGFRLIIEWEHDNFRILVSELGLNAYTIKQFFENRVASIEFELPNYDK